MNFLLRIFTSILVGLGSYLFTLCEEKGGDRHFIDLFLNHNKFFNTFDPLTSNYELRMSAIFGITFGLCIFVFWPADEERKL